MDLSNNYIKMCQKASEIQTVWDPHDGDCINPGGHVHYDGWDSSFTEQDNRTLLNDRPHIWLPRQDQLQSFIWNNNEEQLSQAYYIVQMMRDWVRENLEYSKQFKSMEQLWLAYAMHMKFGKIWAGEEWIEQVANDDPNSRNDPGCC